LTAEAGLVYRVDMLIILLLVGLAFVVLSFRFVNQGPDAPLGIEEGNYHTAYYGKNKHILGRSAPCEECRPTGCTGAGQCRCPCHEAARDTAKKK
jgi:hypothetical protein